MGTANLRNNAKVRSGERILKDLFSGMSKRQKKFFYKNCNFI